MTDSTRPDMPYSGEEPPQDDASQDDASQDDASQDARAGAASARRQAAARALLEAEGQILYHGDIGTDLQALRDDDPERT